MADDAGAPSRQLKRTLYVAGEILAGLWIGGGTLFFLLRFVTFFYRDNAAAIDAFWGQAVGR